MTGKEDLVEGLGKGRKGISYNTPGAFKTTWSFENLVLLKDVLMTA